MNILPFLVSCVLVVLGLACVWSGDTEIAFLLFIMSHLTLISYDLARLQRSVNTVGMIVTHTSLADMQAELQQVLDRIDELPEE